MVPQTVGSSEKVHRYSMLHFKFTCCILSVLCVLMSVVLLCVLLSVVLCVLLSVVLCIVVSCVYCC